MSIQPKNTKILVAVIIAGIIIAISAFFVQKAESPTIDNDDINISESRTLAESWIIKKSPTYTFDGMDLNFQSESVKDDEYVFVFSFDSRGGGYGDRSDMMITQAITPHTIEVTINKETVIKAVTDGVFDEMTGEMLAENTPETREVDLFFVKTVNGTEDFVAIGRVITATENIEKTTLEELLKGILLGEEEENLSTAINEGVEINSFEIVDGVAKVDFDETLQKGVAGSAWVGAIRTQIEKTLMQFESVNSVEISINGESEQILQP